MILRSGKVVIEPSILKESIILRSGKVVIKRNKHERDKDFISKLPDELLTHILSLLPLSDANRTRVLSKRWADLCAFLPNLHFVTPYYNVSRFYYTIEETLDIRDGMPIDKFLLDCTKCSYCDYNRVYELLSSVVICKVKELELIFLDDRKVVRFCWDLFKTCNTLVGLTLKGEFVLDVPKDGVLFPCLKKLELVSIVYVSEESFEDLMAGCPVLEELYMERKWGEDDNLYTFNIVSPSLKRLRVFFNKFLLWVYEIVIDAPKLEFLAITDGMSTMYSLTETSSLVEALISFDDFVTEFMTYLSGVKLLTLDTYSIKNLSSVDGSNLPMFPNLVKLVIFIDCGWHLDLLRVLLNKMPNLEHITFMDGPRGEPIFGINWNPPWEAPSCLRLKIKEIVILNQDSVSQLEFTFIRYLLKHGVSLERLTINVPTVDPERREELLSIHRGSSLCQIQFV